ncbi:hypothetical protein DL771_008871 [Monosporascus sp. 5C6A]|nr:hypothetical protein DL771_008871 [Monosporascus sp. 5C6A]
MMSSEKQYVQDWIRELALENPAWHGLEGDAVGQLDALPADSPYLLVKLNMLLLEWTSRHSTRKDLKKKLQQQPTTLKGCYTHAMGAIDDANRNWVTTALRWIAHAVRPLRPTELAVAVALGDIPGSYPWKSEVLKDLGDLIRRDIIGNLKHFMAPLIKVEDNRVYLVHDTFRIFLLDTFTQTAPQTADPTSTPKDDSTQDESAQDEPAQNEPAQDESMSGDGQHGILLRCLEYLKRFGQHGSASIMCKDGTQCSLPTHPEFGLLSYASLHWPQHFRETTSKSAAHDYVLQFLQDDKRVESWTNLYHQLKPSLKSNSVRLDNPLKIVCNFGLIELVDDCISLVKSSEDFQGQMRESLNLAAENGHDSVIQILLKEVVRSSETLGLAAVGGFEDVVESLLDVDVINKPDQTQYAPLHHATCGGHKHIVALLLAKGADPNIPTSPPPGHEGLPYISGPRRRIRRRRYYDSESESESDSDMDESISSPSETETTALSRPLWSETSLHLAALTGQIEIAEILLAQGADVSAENSSGYDPLKYAAMGGFPELLTLLLQDNVVDKASESDGNTALHLAAEYGHYKAAEILLQKTSDAPKLIHTMNTSGLSPIHIAAREGHLTLLDLMHGVEDRNKDAESIASGDRDHKRQSSTPPALAGNPPLSPRRLRQRRLRRRSIIVVSPERKSRPSSVTPGSLTTSKDHHRSALEWAAENGHCHIVRALLARKDWSKVEDRAFALNLAAQNGHTSIVTILLDDSSTKAATDYRQNTALHLAGKRGHSETLVELLTHSRGATLFQIDATTKRGMTPLHVAAQAGHADIVEILLQHKAKTDLTDRESKAALHLAAENGHLPCVETLLQPEYGADPKAVDSQESTALHLAAQNGHLAVVERLCAFKDIIWMKDGSHYTAFDLVVNRDKVKEVEEFIRILKDTADDGTEFVRGGSPLQVIARHKNMDILRLLLDRGWKCDSKDTTGATPLHRAVMYNFVQGIELLLQNPLSDITARDAYGSTVMHYATTPEVANSLLKAGAENDQKDNSGRTPLFVAAYRGRFEVVQALSNSMPKPDVHTKEEDDWTLLHAAYDSPSITKLILEHNVNPNALNDDGRTPLALTIRWNFPENTKLLLGAGANPNLAGDFKNSPLYLAFEGENSLELIQLLAENGADLLAKDTDGTTALHIAAQRDKRPEVEYLAQKLGDIETTEISDIYASVLCECVLRPEFNSELPQILVSRGLDVNRATEPHFTALHAACSKGSIDAVKWLLEKKSNVNMPGGKHGTTVCAAVESEKDAEEKVRLLLEKGAYIDFVEENQPTALQRATSKANTTLIDLLLNKGANVNLTGGDLDTPLNAAILGGVRSTTIRTMLANGADTSKTGVGGKLPVHVAAASDRVDVLQVLVNAGADPLARDTDGRSALMHGVANCSADAVNYLLENNAFDVSEADARAQTPLIVATMFSSKAIVNMLLERGFSKPEILNAQDYEGKTALARAASLDYLEIVRKLVNSGADPRIVDCRNRSPLYWAARAARMETLGIIIAALDECGSDTIECWDVAVHGAVASNKRQALERLLENKDVDVEYAGPDGWSPLYTARRYGSYRMEHILQEGAGVTSPFTADLMKPSSWHSNDRSPGLELESNGTTLSTVGGTKFINWGYVDANYGAVRADYPMLPLFKDKVYFFEIKITKAAKQGSLAVGFCDDKAPLQRMLGWDSGSWGFHSDNGCLFEDGKRPWEGIPYNNPYAVGDVIGCGVNFAENSAFYTRDEKVIGRAFMDIRGKLYPAVSMDIAQKGWEISAVFPGKDGKSADFMEPPDHEINPHLETRASHACRDYEYIHLGRRLGADFEHCLVKLDNARLRLSRWAEAVGLGQVDEDTKSSRDTKITESDIPHAKRLLEAILLDACYNAEKANNDRSLVMLSAETDLSSAGVFLLEKTCEIDKKRQSGLYTRQKAMWALHDGTHCKLGLLEKALVDKETLGLNKSLQVLKDVIETQDKTLASALDAFPKPVCRLSYYLLLGYDLTEAP